MDDPHDCTGRRTALLPVPFDAEPAPSNVRRSLVFSFAEKYLIQAITIGTTAVMARLLTPAETGLFMIGYGLILVIESFRDFGVGTYIVQKKALDAHALRTAFTITMLMSLLMGGTLFACAPWIGRAYDEPQLATILRIGTLGFLLVPFGTPLVGLMRRAMAFRTLAWINVLAAALGAGLAIALAMSGLGALSYIWGALLSGTATTVMAFCCRPRLEVFRPSLREWREVASFGAVASLLILINMSTDLLPKLLLGRLWGFEAVGLFARAATLSQLTDRMIAGALNPVVLPAMAAQARKGGDLKAAYLRGHELMSAVQWPALVVMTLLAMPVVRLLLGAQWLETAPLVRIMAAATMMLAPAFMTYPLLVAVGRVNDALIASLISLPPSALIVAATAHVGPQALAASMLVTAPLQMAVAFWFITRAIDVRWTELLVASCDSAIATAMAAAAPALVVMTSPTGFDLDIGRTVGAAGGAALGWLAGLYRTGHPLGAEVVRAWCGLTGSLSRSAAL